MKPAPPVTSTRDVYLFLMARTLFHKERGPVQAFDRADIEPFLFKYVRPQGVLFEVQFIDVGYLIFSPLARRDLSDLFENRVVIYIQSCHRKVTFRTPRFLLARGDLPFF